MAHYGNVEITATTPKEWLAVGATLGRLVNEWSGRNDLAVLVADKISHPNPALYNPTTSEIEVSIPMAFGIGTTPNNLGDLSDKSIQYENAKAVGVIYHESCHARFSQYSLEDASKVLNENEFGALHLLEESRVEHWGIRAIPTHREFLRSSSLEIVLAEIDKAVEKMSMVRASAYVAGLTLARVDAGVLDSLDVLSVSELLNKVLGADNVARLREVWLEFQAHADHANAEPLYELARKWESIVKEISEQAGQEPPKGGCEFPVDGGDGEDGQDGEAGQDGEKGKGRGKNRSIGDLVDALSEDADNTMLSSRDKLDRQQTAEDWDKEVKARQSSAKRNADHQQVAKKIMENKRGNEPACSTNSALVDVRKPTAIERSSAVFVAKMLEKAKYRERDVVVHNQVVPAGKLRTRTIVQAQALKAKGILTPIEMWKNKTRKQTDEPTLSIGVMVDISGSMSSAMKPMASTAWVLSEAGRRVQARTSMVYFGSDVFPTLKAGQHLEEVLTYSANDYTEQFDKAFQATDGMLNLLNGSGARLLVVVSDGNYTNEENKKARDWIAECKRSGVAVLWIGYDNSVVGAKFITRGTDAELISVSNEIGDASKAIGEMASKVLSKMGERNSY